MKQPDLNHLRRELTTQQQRVLQIIEAGIARGTPPTRREIANEMGFRSANAADEHVRALATLGFIVVEPGKARNIRPANDVPKGGAAMLRATAESRAVIDVFPGAGGGPELPLSDLAMEEGLAEVGITVWGPRAEDWAAGAEYAVRLMRECLPKAAAETLPDRPDAAGNPAAPPALRLDDTGGVGVAGQADKDGGSCTKGARDATGRTPIDYAVEHAEYLAVAAEHLIFSMHKVDECTDMHDEDDSVLTEHDLEVARERCTEATNSLRSRIHEFRKRRDRAAVASQKSEGEAC